MASSMTAALQKSTLKINFEGELCRIRNWPEDGAEPTIEDLQSVICGTFDLSPAQKEALCIKYQDDDGDWCTLIEASIPDAISFATQRGVLRLTASCETLTKRSMSSVNQTATEPELGQSVLAEESPSSQCYESAEETETVSPPAEASRTSNEEDPFAQSATSASERFAEVRRVVSEQLSETRRAAMDHLENVCPHVAEGVACFKQQVTNDFESSSNDMKVAFGVHEARGLGTVREVTGAAAGVVTTARLMPIRVTRLAAYSIAAAVGKDISYVDTADTDNSQSAAVVSLDASEFKHFKRQVKHDFQSSRDDMRIAFNCILRESPSTVTELPVSGGTEQMSAMNQWAMHEAAIEQDNLEPQQQSHQSLKTALSSLVSTVVGGSAAACLLPLRAVRFAVANLSGIAASRAEAADTCRPESAPSTEPQAVPESSSAEEAQSATRCEE